MISKVKIADVNISDIPVRIINRITLYLLAMMPDKGISGSTLTAVVLCDKEYSIDIYGLFGCFGANEQRTEIRKGKVEEVETNYFQFKQI
jgi:hypothetical protein